MDHENASHDRSNAAVDDFDSPERLAETVVDTIYFDDIDGDVKLIVRNESGENVAFVVSSAAMIRACKPWNRMLAGPFLRPSILDFRDDNYESLKILMHITHFQFPQVPISLTITGLHQMSIVTDKYFATSLVAPWILRWVEALEDTLDGSSPLWLWIAWEYGLIDKFDRVSHALFMNLSFECKISASNTDALHVCHDECGISKGHDLPSMASLPDGIAGAIRDMRSNTIYLLVDPIYDYLKRLLLAADGLDKNLSAKTSDDARGLCKSLRRDCLRLQIGSLISSLAAINLWPKKNASEITMSPQSLSEALLRIDLSDCNSYDFSPRDGPPRDVPYARGGPHARGGRGGPFSAHPAFSLNTGFGHNTGNAHTPGGGPFGFGSNTGFGTGGGGPAKSPAIRHTCGSFSEIIEKIHKIQNNNYSVTTTKYRRHMRQQRMIWDKNWTPDTKQDDDLAEIL